MLFTRNNEVSLPDDPALLLRREVQKVYQGEAMGAFAPNQFCDPRKIAERCRRLEDAEERNRDEEEVADSLKPDDTFGSWEGYHIWEKIDGRPKRAEMPWKKTHVHEILPKNSFPERTIVTRAGRRNSISEAAPAAMAEPARRVLMDSGRASQRNLESPAPPVPGPTGTEKRLHVNFNYEDGSKKEWSDALKPDDTE
jgi:hypothetical protein